MPGYSVSLSPGVCSNSCLLSWWCHPVISSSVTPFSSCPQSLPALGSFPVIQLYSHSTETSALASVFPMNILGWFPLGFTGLIFLLSKGLSRVFSKKKKSSPAPQFENITSSALSLLYGPTLISIYDCWKNHTFDYCWQRDVSTF